MSYILLFLFLGSTTMIFAETPSEIDLVKERLQNSAEELSIIGFSQPPEAASYLNHDLTKNSPHKIRLRKQLTKYIREWSPRLLALDPTCPYYYSKLANSSASEGNLNLLSYFLAIESNRTLDYPFINILPQTYRNAVPLLSIFRCSELVYSTSSPFFHNIEFLIGPGKTELPLERQSNLFSKLYCSLYGWPHFLLVNQTKQPTITYDAQTLLSQDNLTDIDFFSTSLAPGICLFVPPDWVSGAQLNNSISIVFTLKKIEQSITNEADYEPLPCTHTGESTLATIDFAIPDTFNITAIGLIVYFYQYLNPPMFDTQYTAETFFNRFREDRNVSQLIMTWTPELIDLVNNTLFEQLDINHDGRFSSDDYFDIKQSNLQQLHDSILEILEKLRRIILVQYNQLNDTITQFTEQFANLGDGDNTQEALEEMMANLPDQVKARLADKNVNVKEVLNKVKDKKFKRPSTNKQRVREDDASILFDKPQDEEILSIVEQDQEEEITAEPIINETEPHRTDL